MVPVCRRQHRISPDIDVYYFETVAKSQEENLQDICEWEECGRLLPPIL